MGMGMGMGDGEGDGMGIMTPKYTYKFPIMCIGTTCSTKALSTRPTMMSSTERVKGSATLITRRTAIIRHPVLWC